MTAEFDYTLNKNSKLEVCNVILKYNGTDYALDDVDSITFANGKKKELRRGLGSNSKIGVSISTSRNTPSTYTIITGNISVALFNVLSENFENDVPDRFTLFFYDKAKKVSRSIENCLLTDDPEQMNYNDTFYQTTMTFQCFK